MTPKALGIYHGARSGPPGDDTEYLMPRDINSWDAAWAAHLGQRPDPVVVAGKDAGEPGPMDPERKARHDEAMRFVREYTGTFGLILDIRANPRYGMARFRLSDRQVEVILASRDRDAARAAQNEIDRELYAADEYQRLQLAARDLAKTVGEAILGPSPAMAQPVTEGVYRLTDGTIAKVQRAVHGSRHLYAKALDTDTGDFNYVSGLIRRIDGSQRLTVEEAGAFGKLYGRCIVCGRTLTDEKSIADGIGPVCAGKV